MSTEFKREDRYFLIKRSDIDRAPLPAKATILGAMVNLEEAITRADLPRRQFLVVESDWPEYELVWQMIESRVRGDVECARAPVDRAVLDLLWLRERRAQLHKDGSILIADQHLIMQSLEDSWTQIAATRAEADVHYGRLVELRDALVESMGTEGGIPMTDRLAAALEICGGEAKREACPASESPVVKEGQPTLEAIEAQWSEFLGYLDPQEAGEECAHLGLFAGLLDIAREQRDQLVRLREIEVSEEVHGILAALGADGTMLVCGEFKSGREFHEKYRVARRSSSPQPATGADAFAMIDRVVLVSGRILYGDAVAEFLSRLSQPSADVKVVPREEWECIQRIVKAGRNWLTDSKDNAVEDLSFELTQLNWIRNPADALRSPTNHDGEEAPRG